VFYTGILVINTELFGLAR